MSGGKGRHMKVRGRNGSDVRAGGGGSGLRVSGEDQLGEIGC